MEVFEQQEDQKEDQQQNYNLIYYLTFYIPHTWGHLIEDAIEELLEGVEHSNVALTLMHVKVGIIKYSGDLIELGVAYHSGDLDEIGEAVCKVLFGVIGTAVGGAIGGAVDIAGGEFVGSAWLGWEGTKFGTRAWYFIKQQLPVTITMQDQTGKVLGTITINLNPNIKTGGWELVCVLPNPPEDAMRWNWKTGYGI